MNGGITYINIFNMDKAIVKQEIKDELCLKGYGGKINFQEIDEIIDIIINVMIKRFWSEEI